MPANLQIVQDYATPSATFAEPVTAAATPGNVTQVMASLPDFGGKLRLARLIAMLKEATADAIEAEKVIERLNSPIKTAMAAEGRLQAILDQDAAAMAAWAETGEGDPPASDMEAIAQATKDRDHARAAANAAQSALANADRKLGTAQAHVKAYSQWAATAAYLALADEAAAGIASFRSHLEASQLIGARIQALAMMGFDAARSVGGDNNSIGREVAQMCEAMLRELERNRDEVIVRAELANAEKSKAYGEWAQRLRQIQEEVSNDE